VVHCSQQVRYDGSLPRLLISVILAAGLATAALLSTESYSDVGHLMRATLT
jgi:hypothetical protein